MKVFWLHPLKNNKKDMGQEIVRFVYFLLGKHLQTKRHSTASTSFRILHDRFQTNPGQGTITMSRGKSRLWQLMMKLKRICRTNRWQENTRLVLLSDLIVIKPVFIRLVMIQRNASSAITMTVNALKSCSITANFNKTRNDNNPGCQLSNTSLC